MFTYVFTLLSVSLGLSFLVYLVLKYWSSLRCRKTFPRGPAWTPYGGLLAGLLRHLKAARMHYSNEVFNLAITTTASDLCCWATLFVLNYPYTLTFHRSNERDTQPSSGVEPFLDEWRHQTSEQSRIVCSNVSTTDIVFEFFIIFMIFLAAILRYDLTARYVRSLDCGVNDEDSGHRIPLDDSNEEWTVLRGSPVAIHVHDSASNIHNGILAHANGISSGWYYASTAFAVVTFLCHLTMSFLPKHYIGYSMCIEQTGVFLPASSALLLITIFTLSCAIPLVVCYNSHPYNEQEVLVQSGKVSPRPERGVLFGVTMALGDWLANSLHVSQATRQKSRKVFSRCAKICLVSCIPSVNWSVIYGLAAANTDYLHFVLHSHLCMQHIVLLGVCSTAWNFVIIT